MYVEIFFICPQQLDVLILKHPTIIAAAQNAFPIVNKLFVWWILQFFISVLLPVAFWSMFLQFVTNISAFSNMAQQQFSLYIYCIFVAFFILTQSKLHKGNITFARKNFIIVWHYTFISPF